MAHFFRLIRALLLCALFSPLASFADFEKSTQYVYKEGGNTLVGPGSLDSVCSGFADLTASRQTRPLCSYGTVYCTFTPEVTGEACYIKRMPGGAVDGPIPLEMLNGCPKNSTVTADAKCRCEPAYFERSVNGSTQCLKPDDRTPEQLCEDAALLYNSTLQGSRFQRVKAYLREYADGGLTCADVNGMPSGMGCKHWFTGDLGFKDDQGHDWTNGTSVALNKGDPRAGGSLVCGSGDGDAPPKEKPPPEDCKNGYKGQVNGVDVCIEAWTGDTEGNDWNRNTDGEGNQTDEDTNIKCKGDQCTVTQTKTTTKQDGTTTTTTTTTENVNRQGYCARNPESAICRRQDDPSGGDKGPATRPGGGSGGGSGDGDGEGEEESPSQFGGTCAASFTCEGDAIQCAIAKEQHIRNCKLFEDKSEESDLYNANKGKTGNQTGELPGNEVISITGRIDTSDALGGGGCFGDLNVTVWNTSVSLPLSNLCQYLAMLGNILVAVSMLMAARIVTRG